MDAWVKTLLGAVNAHDLAALVDHFSDDYANETPAHPARGFIGSEQVRTNWSRMFAAIPDLSAEVRSTAVAGETVWTEWTMRGTRPDGSAHLLRGVVLFGVRDGRAAWGRFYLEPVDDEGTDVDAAVTRIVAP
jgi:ketosteroid isomerase-like protein